MSDYERGYYYGLYRKRVRDDQILAQKIYGVIISVIGIGTQIAVGMFEFCIVSAWIVMTGIYILLSKENYMKEN